jgi:nucleoside-diphosphate-sugar epimerase
MKILVTGAAGRIGREITKGLIANNYEVLAIDRAMDKLSLAQKFVVGDLVSVDFISRLDFHCDAIVHLASTPAPNITTDEVLFHNNVIGTYNVFAAAAKNKVPLVIYASSLAIYGSAFSSSGTSPKYFPIDESYPLTYFESYALSKEVNELSAHMWANRSECAFVGFRFPFTDTNLVISEMAINMRRGNKASLEVGARIFWAYLDLRDAVQGILTVIEQGAKGSKTYNFAAPDTMAPRPTIEMLAEYHPTSQLISPPSGYDSIIDCSAWRLDFGYEPKYLWGRSK